MTPADQPNRLFLLDGMALVYRAHFALIRNPIINSKGTNTSALFGFTNTLLSIIQNEQPTHLAVAWDTSAPTPRHDKFPDYKANRDEMPDELRTAIPHCKTLCQAFQIPLLEIDGYEADDLIGTLAKTADAAGDYHTFMVTPDKDFAQLISPTTTMWKPGRKGSDSEAITLDKLEEIWGVKEPHQIIDLLGLMGDTADNIPGVPGIGPKTAVKLIAQFGSVESLLENTSQLKGKQKEKVEDNKANALLSKDLATIITDAPLETTFDDLLLTPADQRDNDAIQALFAENEFKSLTKRLFGSDQTPNPTTPNKDSAKLSDSESLRQNTANQETELQNYQTSNATYILVDTPKKEKDLFAALKKAPSYCFDLETTSLDRFTADILGIAFAIEPGTAYYLPYNQVHHPTLQEIFALPAEKIGHNLKFDLHILNSHGIQVAGPFLDTMLVHALLYPEQRHTMDRLAENLLNYQTIKLTDLTNPDWNASDTLAPQNPATSQENSKNNTDSNSANLSDSESLRQKTTTQENQTGDLFALAEANEKKPRTKKAKGKKAELDMKAIPLEALATYAAEDADITLQLAHHLRPLLEENKLTEVYTDIEAPLLPVLVQMESEGIGFAPELLAEVGADLENRIHDLSAKINAEAGQEDLNLNSPKQLGEVLFDKLKLVEKPKKTKTGQYKTDEQTLTLLAPEHPIVANILQYRQATKLKSTYIDTLPNDVAPHDNRIHTHLHQHIAATGRMASSDPNLQNIPIRTDLGREIRKAFVPRQNGRADRPRSATPQTPATTQETQKTTTQENLRKSAKSAVQNTQNPATTPSHPAHPVHPCSNFTLLAADYSQIELRIMAALSGDPGMISAFQNDEDIHTATAAKVYGISSSDVTADHRRTAKMVNFGIIYGISAFGLSQRLGIPRGEASEIIKAYWEQYPKIKDFMDTTIESAKEHGYVQTLSGRRRRFPDIKSGNPTVRGNAERAAINTPIQGTAADMIKLAMIQVDQLLYEEKAETRMLLQVHDELLFDLAKEESDALTPKIVAKMESALELPNDVPIKVEIGTGNTWLEAH
ncbi:MAG: DNA polymerase I [Verrucomicrobiota bacterium]